MSQRAWKVAAVWFFGLTILGCGTNPPPEKPAEASKDQPTLPESNLAVSPVQLVYELDPSRHVMPARMVMGSSGDVVFAPKALVEEDYLIFRTLKEGTSQTEREIKLKLGSVSDPKSFDNRKVTIRPEMPPGAEVPEIWVTTRTGDFQGYSNGYALTLELGYREKWKINGKIYLCLPDKDKTVLAGSFFAAFPRQVSEPPGVEDLPYIKGYVNVIGAPPKTTLRVGFAATPDEQSFALGTADVEIREPLWVRTDFDKPPITTLIAGDGKTVPSRYEHSKLTPARYLVFATLEPATPGEQSGPAAWQWVTVSRGEVVSADMMTIDVTKTGGLQVDVPDDSLTMVRLVPIDKLKMQMIEQPLFIVSAVQMGLQQPIIARKAIFKKLAPGTYDVRTCDEVRTGVHATTVEIVAGKIAELNFSKPKEPGKKEVSPEPKKTETVPEPKPKQ
jgi:hypothetical protein